MVWSDSALYLREFENQRGKVPAQVTWLPSFQSLEHTMLPPSALCTCCFFPLLSLLFTQVTLVLPSALTSNLHSSRKPSMTF